MRNSPDLPILVAGGGIGGLTGLPRGTKVLATFPFQRPFW